MMRCNGGGSISGDVIGGRTWAGQGQRGYLPGDSTNGAGETGGRDAARESCAPTPATFKAKGRDVAGEPRSSGGGPQPRQGLTRPER